MIKTVLIANRGEIACRVIRTARRLGLRTIAVYSEADAGALHVELADEAHAIGPAPARASYLDSAAILDAAKRSGADAIHPGYGFLSENADFAAACAAAGVIFIGPPPAAIRAMGSKSAAKDLMEKAGVPLVPGYHGAAQDPAVLAKAAKAIGYPVLIKASAGGGGRGMRVVERAAALADALAAARREAEAAFGDPQLLIEKYLARPRHIEVQVFADTHDHCIHLFERDCSIQRRYQKVIEEAPAPGMTAARRAAIGAAAIAAARAVGYVGAGTVEFIAPADADDFYFMEMNTRLQVEHPVTEAITGLDLVEWQIRVADGEALPLAQDAVTLRGHAVEARLYAEDPARDFLPQPGRLEHVRFPVAEGVRVDTGVRSGAVVPRDYDAMIAKVIAWGETRAVATARLVRALADTEIAGVRTNRALLAAIVGHPAFAKGALDTGFIAHHRAALLPPPTPADARILALATLARLLEERGHAHEAAAATADPHSPWAHSGGWRLNREAWQECLWRDGDSTVAVRARFSTRGFALRVADTTIAADGALAADGVLHATIDGVRVTARVVRHGDGVTVFDRGAERRLGVVDPLLAAAAGEAAAGKLTAPMPGRIAAVRVAPGEHVARGHALIVVEAMKMEHTITAPAAGRIGAVHYRVGDLVDEGAELLVLEVGVG
ncbi:MAG: acetyl-CoA carboxylase biotin carboxylase subunit [Proteobacteria bacterium]|nr:acetyl-CoA carboxylase biotin carboxylase subunit [Pseudomonadota bacterium]